MDPNFSEFKLESLASFIHNALTKIYDEALQNSNGSSFFGNASSSY